MPSRATDPARLMAARKAAGLTRSDVAGRLGLVYAAVQAYELGISDPSAHVLVGLARLYGVPVEALCRDPAPAAAR